MKRLVLVLPFLLMGAVCPAPQPTPAPPTPTPPVVEPTPVPTPTPGGCGAPLPGPAVELTVKVHNAFCANLDSTVKVGGKDYCAQIGFTDGRSVCPVRMEGAADRVACERLVIGPSQRWSCEGEGCRVYPCHVPGNCECGGAVNTNPSQAIVMGKGKVTTCTFDGKVCGSVVIQ